MFLWINDEHKSCMQCPDMAAYRNRITCGYGNVNSIVMFVGIAPGRLGCDITGIPFTKDKSGLLFQECLQSINLKMEDVYTTNIVKCCPKKIKDGIVVVNRNPSEQEIMNCSGYLKKEIEIVKPQLVVALGRIAQDEVKKYKNDFNFKLMNLWHPAYLIRQNIADVTEYYINQFQQIKIYMKSRAQKEITQWLI